MPAGSLSNNQRSEFDLSRGVTLIRGHYQFRTVFSLYDALKFKPDMQEEARRYNLVKKHIERRNSSLLAHGLSPINESLFNDFWNDALEALDVDESDIPRWPQKFELPLN